VGVAVMAMMVPDTEVDVENQFQKVFIISLISEMGGSHFPL
jgi:hypothetical protein